MRKSCINELAPLDQWRTVSFETNCTVFQIAVGTTADAPASGSLVRPPEVPRGMRLLTANEIRTWFPIPISGDAVRQKPALHPVSLARTASGAISAVIHGGGDRG